MSLCSWSAYDMHIKMAQIPFTSFTLEVLHTGIKSINVSVHACQHHNRHSESVQCTVTIMFVSVTITYRHSESVQCSHHHVCVSITDRHSVSSVQSPSCLSVSASPTGTQIQFSAVTIMSVSASQTGSQSQLSAQSPPTFSAKFLRSFSRTYTNGRTTLRSPSLKKKKQISHGKNDE